MKIKSILTRASAGKTGDGSAKSKPLSSLKTRCKQLTVGDYIEIICDNNFDVLTISGTPTLEEQNEAMMVILSELSTLSGDGESQTMVMYNKIISQQAKIDATSTCLQIIASGMYDKDTQELVYHTLGECGISTRTWKPETAQADIKRAETALKSIAARMKLDVEKYNKMAASNDGKKLTEQDIREEMAVLGQHNNTVIADTCNLATYGAMRKTFKSHLKALENAKRRINTKG